MNFRWRATHFSGFSFAPKLNVSRRFLGPSEDYFLNQWSEHIYEAGKNVENLSFRVPLSSSNVIDDDSKRIFHSQLIIIRRRCASPDDHGKKRRIASLLHYIILMK